ncbi:MAG: NUDIX hydrolase [Candidatus Magasanikbacteria bacterium]
MSKIKQGKINTVFKGKIFNIKHQDITLPDGSKTIYEFCERPASVSILALNENGRLLLIKEKRVGYNKNVWFLPGGRVDQNGDTPRKAAQRELREETGFRAKKLKLIRKKHPASTLLWDIYIYAAKDLVVDPLESEIGEEIIDMQFFPIQKAMQMAIDSTIENEFISYNIIRFGFMLKRGEFTF